MKRLLAPLALLLWFAAPLGFAAETAGIDFTIRYYEERIYYVGDNDHPVLLEAIIANNSSSTYRFKMADNRFFSLDFEVTTPTNIRLEPAAEFIKSRNRNQPVFYRDVDLQPGEKYALVLVLQDFVRLDKPGMYTVQGLFYPEMNRGGGNPALRSNSLALSMRPEIVFPEERARIEAETGKTLERVPMPPDEVVDYMLSARQRSQWEKFLLYLDLESLYLRNPGRAESYRRMSEENRRATLERYRRGLLGQTVDQDIAVVPASYDILQTSYTPFEGTVTVIERFRYPDYTEIKKYTYTLERRDRIWLITDYEVVNQGTE